MPPKVSIVVLNYNAADLTIRCLESLKKLEYPNFDVIVVDNASEDAGRLRGFVNEQINSSVRFRFIPSDRNGGYGAGNNIGIRQALEHGAEWVLILNNDATVEPNLLTRLTESAREGIAAPAVHEGERIIYGGRIEWLKTELRHSTEPLSDSFYFTGAALLVSRAVFEDIGFFDERYFLYFEDADFCLRARKRGHPLVLVPEPLVRHEVSASTKKLGSPLLLRYHFRNAHLFNLKHAPVVLKLALPFWSLFASMKQLAKLLLFPRRHDVSRAILAGIGDFYRGRFGRIHDPSRH